MRKLKPHQKEAKLRRANARLVQQIPDNAALINLCMGIPNVAQRRLFYHTITPFIFRFRPISWEAMNASDHQDRNGPDAHHDHGAAEAQP